jgi:hypothetical protein
MRVVLVQDLAVQLDHLAGPDLETGLFEATDGSANLARSECIWLIENERTFHGPSLASHARALQ